MRLLELKQVIGPESVNHSVRERLLTPETKRDLRQERDEARLGEASARADAERVQMALAAGAIIGTWFWDLPTDRFTIDEAFATAFGLDPALGRGGHPLGADRRHRPP